MSEEIRFCGSVGEVPSLPGTCVIAVELAETIVVTLCGRAAIELPAGRFLYCGSAKGQGGSKARLSRHFKSVRWHIDQLTERGSVVSAVGFSPTLMNVSWYGDLRSCQFRFRGSAAAIAQNAAAICWNGRTRRHCRRSPHKSRCHRNRV